MRIAEACRSIARAADGRVIVATMSAMHGMDQLGLTERRLSSVPLMGGAASLGLGLALARPDVGVIVVDGDASLLMQLGVLVTVAENGPSGFVHVVIENGVQFAGACALAVPGAGTVDFTAAALAAGYRQAYRFKDASAFEAALPGLLDKPGPTFITLEVDPEPSRYGPDAPLPEIPDRQFERMCVEAERLSVWYANHRNGIIA
ncbi:thiamine pyrophosphate-dependent enzyme [Caballeronia sp. J97]|uniref:thiamine pyrophosphate-dependent enzyme n=1 Tax=Caballeronia sp. J97 TaxID=2805429 RepID=UPI002AB18FD6|nr:thiamine pyrophosphate-dependent enzyme [Caballeronia sp. J97]